MSQPAETQEDTLRLSGEPSAPEVIHRGGREFARQDNGRSSLFEKLPEAVRRAVDVAIAEHNPPTFRAVWMQFELGQYGVSFTAFYRYARRLRERVNLVEAATLAAEDDADVDAVLKKLTGRRVLDLLLHTNSSECLKEIAALVTAHSKAAWLDVADRRIALADRRFAEESLVARARLEHDREQLRLKAEFLEMARQRQPKLLANESAPATPQSVNSASAESSNPPSGARDA